jgi:hypothetical protein
MNKILLSGIIAGITLLIFSVAMLFVNIYLFPGLALYYFDSAFRSDEQSKYLFFGHAFIIGMALSFLWERFKTQLTGGFLLRGIEFGLIYGFVATLPAMWLTYSFMNVSFQMVVTWFIFGMIEATIAGLIFEKSNP